MAKRKTPEPHKYMTRKEAAAFLRLSERTLRQYAHDGEGPPFIKIGKTDKTAGRVVYDRDDVIAWMDARKTTRTKGDTP